jgi:hypothetical protein
MSKQWKFNIVSLFFWILLCSLPLQAVGQLIANQPQNATPPTTQLKPVSLPHLYWLFLIHQNQLDARAASEEAKGQDGSWMRNHLQTSLGFSDADYSSVRASAVRLAAEMKDLDAQAAASRAPGRSPLSSADLKDLAAQREAAINNEVAYLSEVLSPENKAKLEAFMTQFFPRKAVAVKPATIGLLAPAEVQK